MSENVHTLDARGLNCPLPILRTKKALATMAAGDVLEITASDPGPHQENGRRNSCHHHCRERHAAGGCKGGDPPPPAGANAAVAPVAALCDRFGRLNRLPAGRVVGRELVVHSPVPLGIQICLAAIFAVLQVGANPRRADPGG